MNPSPVSILADRKLMAACLLGITASLLIGNATTSLWDQDEAAYAGFARNMLVDGNWIVPKFPYAQAHRKVPLVFWMMAASYAVFGLNEFAARLPGVLCIAATAVSIAYGGRFLVGRRTAALAGILFASTLFVLNVGKIAVTDGPLLLFQTIAALALLKGSVHPSWRSTVLLWLAVAAGLLTKGPPILILVGGMFVFLLVFHRRRRNLVHFHPWFGLPLALLPLALWVGLAWQEDQRYVLFLGYWYLLRRAGGVTFGHGGPPGTYFVLLFFCLVPWTGYLFAALGEAWRSLRRRRLRFVLLGSWLFGGWVIWELLPSKLPTYSLGAVPALMLLLAHQLQANLAGRVTWATHGSLRVGFRVLLGACLVGSAAILVIGIWLCAPWAKVLAALPAAAILGTALLATHRLRQIKPRSAIPVLLFGSLITQLLVWLIIIPGLEQRRSCGKQIAAALAPLCVRDTTLVAVKPLALPSLPFYAAKAGLGFREAAAVDVPRARVQVDWALLWQLRFRELVRQVEAQNPEAPSEKQERVLRLERVAELYRSGQRFAFLLDEEQYAALRGLLADARVLRFQGWLSDHFQDTAFVVAIAPAALGLNE